MNNTLYLNEIQNLYNGFSITKPIGNNVFSYEQRVNKKIFVAPILIPGTLKDLAVGGKNAFIEIDNSIEISRSGLKNFVYWKTDSGKHVFIFDNHNHAFFFWFYVRKTNIIKSDLTLIHVDQHRDWREPDIYLPFDHWQEITLLQAFEYTNFQLNVGNFIKPALALHFFSEVKFVDQQESLAAKPLESFILDLDIDIFAPLMDYLNYEFKIRAIQNLIAHAGVITIATSPFFMDQDSAIRIIKELFVEN